ncbi:MAG: DUF427 domain-containing protein [Gammaproteobacteria bacterium]
MKSNSSAWLAQPNYQIDITPVNKRIVIKIDNQIILDSQNALLLSEQGHHAVYYFPASDIKMAYLEKISKETFCPFKGSARHWSLLFNNRTIEIAAWSYEQPFEQVKSIKDYIAFYPAVMKNAILY